MAQTAVYQLQKTDVRVNSVCPGLIETGMTTAVFQYARQKGAGSKIGQLNPLGRYGIADGTARFPCSLRVFDTIRAEIANVVTFLASGMLPRCVLGWTGETDCRRR